METFYEILKLCLPLIIALIMVYLVIDKFLKNEDTRRNYLIRQKDSTEILGLKLQAYERIILYLERIAPEALVGRIKTKEMTADVLRFAMAKTIQKEYEHNLAQQIYISEESWAFVSKAKDAMINLVHTAAVKSSEEKRDMLVIMQEILDEMEAQPHNIALTYVRKEVAKVLM